jgi:hypothetical protein
MKYLRIPLQESFNLTRAPTPSGSNNVGDEEYRFHWRGSGVSHGGGGKQQSYNEIEMVTRSSDMA